MAVAKRARVFQHPGRVAIVMVVLLLTLTLGATLLHNTDTSTGGSRPTLPSTIEAIHPERGELTGLVDNVEVDLNDQYTGVLELDGVEIPEDQLDRIEQLGVIGFRPGPGKEFTRLKTGENTVVVHYWLRTDPRPEKPLTFSWRFRAGA
jgi:hypothetical protein